MRTNRTPVWQLVGVTLAIVGFFIASRIYSQHVAARLDADAASIATNASPSIEALSAARGEVLRAEVAVARAIEGGRGGLADERRAAEEAILRMRGHQADYLSMPLYPGERAPWAQVDAATHAFEQLIATCFAAIEQGRMSEARAMLTAQLRPATEQLDDRLQGLVTFNATQQHRMGVEIPQLRRRAARIAYVLDGTSAIFAVLLIALVLTEARRRQSLLGHFSARLEEIAASTVRITASLGRDGNQRPVLGAIVEEACRLVDADYGALGFVGDREHPFEPFVFQGFTADEVKAIGSFPRPVGVLGEVIAQGRPLRLADVTKHPRFRGLPAAHPPMQAFLGVPVRRDGLGAGNLYLARRPGRAPFTDEDQHIIELLAAQAAVAAANARLYHELENERARAQMLADASARMVGSLDYETTLAQAAQAALPAFADLCLVHVADESGAIVKTVMAAGDPAWRLLVDELIQRYGLPAERHPALQALHERRPLRFEVTAEILDQIAQSPEHRQLLARFPVKHGVSVPMVGRARLLGVVSFLSFHEAGFSDSDVGFAEEMARRAALSIDNALLHEDTRLPVRARDDLLAIVSHDLRNPLSSIKMSIELLNRNAGDDERGAKSRQLTSRVARTVDGIVRLIGDLLDASKIESGSFTVEPKAERPEQLIDDALDLFRESAGAKAIRLQVQVDDHLPNVSCDRDRVLQVLQNLIGNAMKFTPDGGVITALVNDVGEQVRFSVRDTGPGIPAAERDHVFDRYWQASHTRRAGAGLGLFIVRGIVEAHGGHAWAEAAPGGGACLCFTLPAAPLISEHQSEGRH